MAACVRFATLNFFFPWTACSLIKFCHGAVPASVIEEVEHKVDCLEMPRRMTWRPVLIHVGEVGS